MPKEVRVPTLSSRQYRSQPYQTHTHTHTGIPVNTNSIIPAANMEAIASPNQTQMGHPGSQFMTSPIQERASAAWTEEDDQRLMEYRAKGQNWVIISEKFPGKTGNACRKRHERLIEKRNANHLDGVRLADLATAYVECREIMWKMVAERVGGERWQIIEQKCMEKGVKTLTTNARASRRAQSIQMPTHNHLQQQQQHTHHAMDASPERLVDPSQDQFARQDDFYGIDMASKVPHSYYNAFAQGPAQDINAFYAQQAAAAAAAAAAPGHSNPHSRRASAAHSVDHSSRAGSHGPMQPPQSTNPFASPQVQQQYFSAGPGGLAMAPTLNSQHFPPSSMAMHQQHNAVASSGLPSISSAFDIPRLPSIMSSQG